MAAAPSVPSRFGKYELLSRLAKGGMAETFRAQFTGEAGVTKQVVIKKVLPALADDEEFVTAFINEAKLSASLSHGNIAQVFDFGKERGDYFIAMELVDGRSLGDVLQRAMACGFASIPEPIACFLTIETLKGLHYAHTRLGDDGRPLGIVHRDISPENVLISFEGQTKVVDFGVAKASQVGRAETEPGTVKGKYLHLSPEQALGRPLDARSDVFAVGILLYRMLCGVLPFEGQMHVAMHAIAAGKYRPASAVNPELGDAMLSVIGKSLSTNRDDRFASALQMQDALASILYSREPTFSSEMIQEWMRWLFGADLAREGRPAQVSAGFEAQLQKWSTSVRPSSVVVAREALLSGTPKAVAQAQITPVLPRGKRPIAASLAAAVGVTLVAGVVAWLFFGPKPKPAPVLAKQEPAVARLPPAAEVPLIATEPIPLDPPKVWVEQAEVEPLKPVEPRPEDVAMLSGPPGSRAANVLALYNDATALVRERQFPAAAAKLDQCIKLMPKYPDCHKLRGIVWGRLGEPQRGAGEFREFLKYAPPGYPDIESTRRLLNSLSNP